MSVIYSFKSDKTVDEPKDDWKFDKTKSLFFSPNYLCQPFFTYGKNEADDANFFNDRLKNSGACMLNEIMKTVCSNIEFDAFPFTDSLTDVEQAPVIELTEKLLVKTRPKLMHSPEINYATAVTTLDARMMAFDHCTLRGSTEYL